MKGKTYLDVVRKEFRRLRRISDAALSRLDETELFAPSPNDGNSAAILMKHMSGNMLSRWRDFLTTDGEKSDRDRDSEFTVTDFDNRDAIGHRWEQGWNCLFAALDSLRDSDLNRTVFIRGEPHTVLQAINRQLTHCAYHTGQIVFWAKALRGTSWRSLSIPKGQSDTFNERPRRYLDDDV